MLRDFDFDLLTLRLDFDIDRDFDTERSSLLLRLREKHLLNERIDLDRLFDRLRLRLCSCRLLSLFDSDRDNDAQRLRHRDTDHVADRLRLLQMERDRLPDMLIDFERDNDGITAPAERDCDTLLDFDFVRLRDFEKHLLNERIDCDIERDFDPLIDTL